ncbi:hypothetical protein JTE90_025580 [Oedothorax gibbosus]|uniref:Uncharacterized protein n=1 Tax=Oedothorax gibbosus TaxID=931172 RepID=A0AAV6TJ77_9ARAC|nr:hypothetical protein JTE90_025580 [Oedothorax gibbosus]
MCEVLCVHVDFNYFKKPSVEQPEKGIKMLLDSYGEIEPFKFDSFMVNRTENCKCIVNNCKKDCW